MAKEMVIVFVYDMEYCKNEEDDPARAVLYFHPGWVSEQQRTHLCGQIVGATHFLSSTFSPPRLISLQSGRFHLTLEGRYMIAVGTDRNIDDWILERRAHIMVSLLKFFHCDLASVADQAQSYNNLCEKLYSMFETYLRILHFSANTFSNCPLLNLPKSASSVFLEAIQILQYCQEIETVLGGTLLYHNKVLATQLDAELTKTLVMTDPYRIKSSAELVQTEYSLPLGVQLLYVYIPYRKHIALSKDSARLRGLTDPVCWAPQKKNSVPKSSKEQTFSAMKRDQSLLFTTVPEEDLDHQSPSETTAVKQNIEEPPIYERPKQDRPKSLNLRFTTCDMTTKPKPETVTTPFNYKTSICSTPLTEKYLHVKPQTIICDSDIEMIEFKDENTNILESQETDSVNSILSLPENINKKIDVIFENVSVPMMLSTKILDKKKSTSFSLQKNIKNNIFMRYYGLGLTNIDSDDIKVQDHQHLYNTIADPLFPVFRSDGVVISKPMYDLCISKHCELLNNDIYDCDNVNSIANTDDWKSIDDFDTEFKDSPKKINKAEANKSALTLPLKSTENDVKSMPSGARPSLTLPLKSLTSENDSLSFSRKNSGVQLTPLMSKLSLLAAIEDRSSGFCSRDTTPLTEFRDLGLTPGDKNYSFLRRGSFKRMDTFEDDDDDDDELRRSVLFVCGQQDTVLTFLLDESAVENEQLIRDLWEVCLDNLGQLETQLRQCLEQYPGATNCGPGEMSEDDSYSYLCLDPQWEATRRGGPWAVAELGALTQMHREFIGAPGLMEITLRNEDGIVYGYRCGETEVYYQQAASCNPGLPPPADAMGVAPLKARRKLERDHGIILL